ncbi:MULTISPECIES: threonine synthase [Fusobacterium]|uniref:threonine synthase n=1 Tax=Fusobacterium TaxID=848 RepID=UPI00147724FE|nr:MULTISPECIES: threonine synthase [Fusobacterium]NME35380.1 threonine synthase [Fusobacterium sp. FSA-380-WT-3A]
MNCISTRNKNISISPSLGILKGISKDGGLFIFENIENLKLSLEEIENLKDLSYKDIAFQILKRLLYDFPETSLKNSINLAYNKFSTEEVTPLVKVNQDYILELFHGPTSAFKDVALSLLPHLTVEAMKINKIDKKLLILTATSGDTGKAALEGFKNIENIKIAVFFPNDGTSTVQKKQMTTQEGNNTYVYGINGNFDDAQSGIKNIFTDKNIENYLKNKNYSFSSANSINIGRLVPQIIYYFYSYINLLKKNEISIGEKVNFIVPSGNFGDILAGYYAKLLGLPINKLVCASNSNKVLTDFYNTGVYNKNREFFKTLSPSMDILISSNLERLLFHLSNNDDKYIEKIMKDLKENGQYEISDSMLKKLQENFYFDYTGEEETKKTIKKVFNNYNYLLDTHTAVGYSVMEKFKKLDKFNCKNILLSTASPFKFSKSVYESIFEEISLNEFEIMKKLSKKTKFPIPENLKDLESKKELHKNIIEKNNIDKTIEVMLCSE